MKLNFNGEGYRNSFNQFLANVPILYTLKTPENQMFSSIFGVGGWDGGWGQGGMECLSIISTTKGLPLKSNLDAASLNPKLLYVRKLINLNITYPSNFPESDSGRISILDLNKMLGINYNNILTPKIYLLVASIGCSTY